MISITAFSSSLRTVALSFFLNYPFLSWNVSSMSLTKNSSIFDELSITSHISRPLGSVMYLFNLEMIVIIEFKGVRMSWETVAIKSSVWWISFRICLYFIVSVKFLMTIIRASLQLLRLTVMHFNCTIWREVYMKFKSQQIRYLDIF